MKCMSCEEEISSRFAHAIAKNSCPFCGNPIVAEALQKVLNSLREVMSEAVSQDFEADAFEFLNANYELVSKNSEEYFKLQLELEETKKELVAAQEKIVSRPAPKNHKGPPPKYSEEVMGVDHEGSIVQVQGDSIQDPEKTQSFLDRAHVKPLNNQDHFKEMVKKIKRSNAGGGGGGGEMSMESLAQASPEAIEEMESMLNSGVPNISSALDNGNDYEDELPSVVEQFVNGGKSNNQQAGSDYNAKDLARLQALQSKSARASRQMQGGSSGLIRR
jgi:hypothetical protein